VRLLICLFCLLVFNNAWHLYLLG